MKEYLHCLPEMHDAFLKEMLLILLTVCSFTAAGRIAPDQRWNPMESHKLFEGDILGITHYTFQHTAVPKDSQLWPKGVIHYVIDSSLESKKADIEKAMEHIESKTCIRFLSRTKEQAYVKIFSDEGCYSYFGRAGVQQPLSLDSGCFKLGTIVHELGHAIGLLHEHNRSDRDSYLEIIWSNIDPGCQRCGSRRAGVLHEYIGLLHEHNLSDRDSYLEIIWSNIDPDFEEQFNKCLPHQNRLINSFDYSSIMMYGEKAFSVNGISKTMRATKPGVKLIEVSDKTGLSESDIFRIKKLYKC